MAARPGTTGPLLVGRSEELATIRALVDRATAGEAGALLVSGDPGVGKTALVQQACAQLQPDTIVLSGAALPLTTMSVPFLALRSALRNRARSDGWSFFQPGQSLVDVPILFDEWLEDRCREHPVVLVVDDLHWADQSTLDVLMYVLAGLEHRRLAVITTMRGSEMLGDGHPLQRWLADIHRLPRIQHLMLEPLDRVATDAQLTALLGVPHRSLVEEVFRHTLGNAYLNRLLVVGVSPSARHLPPGLPADLKSAMLQSWRRLSAPSREISRVLAVGGRPLHASELGDVVGPAGHGDVVGMLREAAENGILDVAPDGAYWFHHPLNAEVLEQGLPDEERQRLHSAFAEFSERRLATAPEPTVELMVALADHHDQARHPAEAYRWALAASAAAGRAGGVAEMLRLLRRAVALRDQLPEAAESRQELLLRLRAAAARTGEYVEELKAIESLLDGLDRDAQPLLAAELLVRRMQLRFLSGLAFLAPDEMREAVRLAATEPLSWQHALALAELAHAESWEDNPDVTAHAEQALALARAAGDSRALSYALTTKSVVAIRRGRRQEGRALAIEAQDAALLVGEYWAYCHAAIWEANAAEMWPSRLYSNMLRGHREELMALGAPHTYIAFLSAAEAGSWFSIGEWRECLHRIRVVLGSDPGPLADVAARLAAAHLAAWQGRTVEAEAHLARADEIFAESSSFVNLEFAACRAEVCLAAGKSAEAFDAAMAGATSPGVAPTMCEWLMPLAARAIADQVQTANDNRRDPAPLLAQLEDLQRRFPSVIRDNDRTTELGERHIDALNQLYDAEAGRARHDPDNGAQWIRVADACRVATLAWEEVYSCWRAAESALVHGRNRREQAASVLRRGLDLAEKLQARAIQFELENLAGTARIRIDRVASLPVPPNQRTELAGLTTREREILGYIVAGRTYGEIARALVISEKTVSSHVSNLLRKTGASNRVDLSRLASIGSSRSTRDAEAE
ncbi:helix-turn-helix transcriptional regulator [Homoserinimonas sp. A520]